jgi:hypothetical protein
MSDTDPQPTSHAYARRLLLQSAAEFDATGNPETAALLRAASAALSAAVPLEATAADPTALLKACALALRGEGYPGEHLRDLHTMPDEIAALRAEQLEWCQAAAVPLLEDPQPQRQDSLTDQMATVLHTATRLGCYDAVDWIVGRWRGAP